MSGGQKVLPALVVVVASAIVSAAFLLGQLPSSRRPSLSLNWSKSGGIAGVSQHLSVLPDGEAHWENARTGDDASWTLDLAEHRDLHDLLSSLVGNETIPREFPPRGGVADFFSYELTVMLDGEGTTLKWVDDWAVGVELPESLVAAQSLIEQMIERSK